jgi:hypothetical protein
MRRWAWAWNGPSYRPGPCPSGSPTRAWPRLYAAWGCRCFAQLRTGCGRGWASWRGCWGARRKRCWWRASATHSAPSLSPPPSFPTLRALPAPLRLTTARPRPPSENSAPRFAAYGGPRRGPRRDPCRDRRRTRSEPAESTTTRGAKLG